MSTATASWARALVFGLALSTTSAFVSHKPSFASPALLPHHKTVYRGAFSTNRRHVHRAVESESGTQAPPNGVTSPSATNGGGAASTTAVLDEGYNYRSAIYRTLGWVSAAVAFGGAIWTFAGPEIGEEFFAGYLVEQSLSVDNLFVFLLLFEYFKVPLLYQDKILNWGIYGAIVMRGVMISLGATALENFHEVLLVFAGILVYSSAKFFVGDDDDEEEDPADNQIVQFSRSLLPSVDYFDGDRFFTLVDGVRRATPLFICMIAVEISDVVFAVDSIPAVFGVTEVGGLRRFRLLKLCILEGLSSLTQNFFLCRIPLSSFLPISLPLWDCEVCIPF